MKVSEFWTAVDLEFGDAYGRMITRDLVLHEVSDRSAAEALSSGVNPRQVWLALCRAMEVPEARWHGAGRLPPKA